jgi:group I intron endonuclease
MLRRKKHDNCFMQRSYDKYGAECFCFELIETVEESLSALLQREQYYIDLHFDKGKKCFNLNPLANSTAGMVISEEAKERRKATRLQGAKHPLFGKKRPASVGDKISTALTGRPLSKEHRAKLSRAKLGKKGRAKTEVEKEKLRQAKLGANNPMFGKKGSMHHNACAVEQFSLDDKLIGIYSSLLEAELTTGISFKAISLCINGKTKTSGGYKWKKSTTLQPSAD